MKGESAVQSGVVLPLPRFVLHPLTAVAVAAVHIYLAAGHLAELAADNVEWTHLWKGFGALAGAYVFAALASRRRPVGSVSCGGESIPVSVTVTESVTTP